MGWTKESRIGSHNSNRARRTEIVRQAKSPHLIVKAGAGCGKTSTAIVGINRLRGNYESEFEGTSQQEDIWDAMESESHSDIAIVAFNKPIAEELQRKVPQGVGASTFHSMCYAPIKETFGKVKLDNFKVDNILENLLGYGARKKNPVLFSGTKRLVEIAKISLWREEDPDASDRLRQLAAYYSVELNGELLEAIDLVPRVLDACLNQTDVIDFNDMIWFVCAHDLPIRKRDLLLVDEAQDLNYLQQEVALLAGDRLILIGDPNQSIYGFRGADAQAMGNMENILEDTSRGVESLPLMKTFRCPQSHVRHAQRLVPDFECFERADEGIIRDQPELGTPADGSLVLCRVNAPLVSAAFKLIRDGVKANIQGRDIGANLINFVKKLTDTPQFKMGTGDEVCGILRALDNYSEKERNRIRTAKFPSSAQLMNLEDKVACLQIFCDGAKNVADIETKIKNLFQDGNQGGILLSSVHRAKGLEADSTFILTPELMPHPMAKLGWEQQQEANCEYVAVTRSKNEMVFIR